MAEILALGISHYPPLTGHDNRMAGILRRMMQNPDLPANLRTPEGWPEAMRTEWGDDEGATSAARHRADLVGWMEQTRAALDAFDPDFVLMWGDDQYENFREDIIPPYCISAYDKFNFAPPRDNVWGETDKTYELAGNRGAAKMLASRLIEQGFDTAYSYKPLHHRARPRLYQCDLLSRLRSQGFRLSDRPLRDQLLRPQGCLAARRRAGFRQDHSPTRTWTRPRPRPGGCSTLVPRRRASSRNSPYRVALLASSGWSHAFLTAKNHLPLPRHAVGSADVRASSRRQLRGMAELHGQAVEDSGQQEILNWMCLAGALSALERKPQETGFVDTWIFNSSKVFLIAPRRPEGMAQSFGTGAYDVIVAGAGPVGLTLAIDLGRRGVRCLIVERNPTTAAVAEDGPLERAHAWSSIAGSASSIGCAHWAIRPTTRWTCF